MKVVQNFLQLDNEIALGTGGTGLLVGRSRPALSESWSHGHVVSRDKDLCQEFAQQSGNEDCAQGECLDLSSMDHFSMVRRARLCR